MKPSERCAKALDWHVPHLVITDSVNGRPLAAFIAEQTGCDEMLAALRDMLSGWKYIRENHGDLYGVGWARAQNAAEAAIAKAEGNMP